MIDNSPARSSSGRRSPSLAGNTDGSVQFDTVPLTSAGMLDVILAKLPP